MRLSHRGKLHASPAPTPPPPPPLIELHDVSLTHNHTPLISHLDLTIRPGEHVALIGLSPTATTALTHLLTGRTTPAHGHITTHTPAHLTTQLHPTHAPLLIHTGPTPPTPTPTTALIHLTNHPTRTADRVLLLHHGRVTETGTHLQLLARGGAYARLYALQGPHRLNPHPRHTP
ncbi:ABC transporter ATP-binding protein [Nocardiopsis sp. EMB25]|uniref:ABC transporter ATP-binding protein n=1 Tax=Nocardiopsis sp. EMB25 TaxID=2835867 RepID=UPI0022846286|nr:ABC transporter ATP-binding protein [Nocardiopsis sp. EMB25]MCY9783835.1 ABC transporter ATP-binding protein [Nocardiopsis sp. EMB25]